MNRRNIWLIGIIVVALILVIVLASFKINGFLNLKNNKSEILIGSIMPLSSDVAVYGNAIRKPLDLAVEEINNSGGINGRQIRIIYEDGLCDPKNSANAANKLINIDKVDIMLAFCSGEVMGASPIITSNNKILLSSGAGSPDITYLEDNDSVFRIFPSDSSSARKISESAINKKYNEIALISENENYSQALIRSFNESYTQLGGNVLISEKFNSENKDFKTSVTKVLSKNPRAIYVVSLTAENLVEIVKLLKEYGFNGQIYTNELIASENTLKNLGSLANGIIFAEPRFDRDATKTKIFLENLNSKYGKIESDLPDSYFATAYDTIYILRDVIDACGDKDIECIKKQLHNIKDYDATSGKLSIDSRGDTLFEFDLKIINNSKAEIYH
ncbi:MAG: ABC transporter substrate-binding protein [archaeon]